MSEQVLECTRASIRIEAEAVTEAPNRPANMGDIVRHPGCVCRKITLGKRGGIMFRRLTAHERAIHFYRKFGLMLVATALRMQEAADA